MQNTLICVCFCMKEKSKLHLNICEIRYSAELLIEVGGNAWGKMVKVLPSFHASLTLNMSPIHIYGSAACKMKYGKVVVRVRGVRGNKAIILIA